MNAADVLTAILFARDQGQEPELILDENSPLMGAAREVLLKLLPSTGIDTLANALQELHMPGMAAVEAGMKKASDD